MVGSKVTPKQRLQANQTTLTDLDGCYKFDRAVSGASFKVIIKGPVVP